MAEDRPGEGKPVSTEEAKINLDRGFRRAEHTGPVANPTEWEASRRLARGNFSGNTPTKNEINLSIKDNPSDWKIYKDLGWSDQQIYDTLSGKH